MRCVGALSTADDTGLRLSFFETKPGRRESWAFSSQDERLIFEEWRIRLRFCSPSKGERSEGSLFHCLMYAAQSAAANTSHLPPVASSAATGASVAASWPYELSPLRTLHGGPVASALRGLLPSGTERPITLL